MPIITQQTAVAYKIIINADLPKISYLTLIDKISFGSFFFIAAVVLENTVVAQLNFPDADHFDTQMSMAFCIGLVLAIGWCSFSGWSAHNQEDQKLKPFREEARAGQALTKSYRRLNTP